MTAAATEVRSEADRVVIESAVLGETRESLVSLPESYSTSSVAYPVILTLDGEFNFDRVSAIVTFLTQAGAMPESIVVGLENTNRTRDMTPTGMQMAGIPVSGGDAFLSFIGEELFPTLASEYRISDLRVLVGHSHGGILGVYSLTARPDLFSGVVALDTPAHLDDFWLVERLQARLADTDSGPVRLALGQSRFVWPDDAWEELVATAPEDSSLARFSTLGESHESMVFLGTYTGLKTMFRPYGDAAPAFETLESIAAAYHRAAVDMGGTIATPAGALRSALDGALMEGRGEDAGALLDRLESLYGRTSATERLRSRVDDAIALGPLDETVLDLVSSERPGRDAMAPYLGVWEGTTDSGNGGAQRIRFTFRWTDNGVVGEATQWMPDGEADTQELVAIRLRDGAFEFGYMNGMRPRGVLLYSCELQGDGAAATLSGEMTLAGVRFRPPGGMTIPRTFVRLSRANPN